MVNLSGFLNINKPKGLTSFDVIYKLRKILNMKKIGHLGTLDPLASGVLPVAIGNATRLLEYLNEDKQYIATVKFGEITKTYDAEGEKTFIKTPDFSKDDLENILKNFTGDIEQIPPIYSAIKVKGKKLYELARNGIEVELAPRKVKIYSIKILEFDLPFVKFMIDCSKGTYIRSFANDIGQKFGCGAYLSDLIRSCAGSFSLNEAQNIDEELKIINPLEILKFKTYELNETEFEKVNNGNSIISRNIEGNERLSLIFEGNLVAISVLCDKIIKVEKVLR